MSIEIRLDSLDQGRLRRSEELKVAAFADRLDDRMVPVGEAFTVEFLAEKYTNVVSVQGRVIGALACQCSRCGEEMQWTVDTGFEHRYMGKGELRLDDLTEECAEELNLDVSEHDGSQIDLTPIVVEQMLVELPIAPICQNPESTGCANLGDAPMEFGDTAPLEQEQTSWSKALEGLDPSKLKGS